MAEMTMTRKQRLRTLENEIRSGMEEFYYTGMKLKEIRDDELYKEDGFTDFAKYCKDRFELSKPYVYNLISSAETRAKLPTSSMEDVQWSERTVRELNRLPDKKDAARVAKKIIAEVEKNPEIKLTSTVVRKFVDADMGVEKTKPQPKREDEGENVAAYLDDTTGTLIGTVKGLLQLPRDAWDDFKKREPKAIKRLIEACESLIAMCEEGR